MPAVAAIHCIFRLDSSYRCIHCPCRARFSRRPPPTFLPGINQCLIILWFLPTSRSSGPSAPELHTKSSAGCEFASMRFPVVCIRRSAAHFKINRRDGFHWVSPLEATTLWRNFCYDATLLDPQELYNGVDILFFSINCIGPYKRNKSGSRRK